MLNYSKQIKNIHSLPLLPVPSLQETMDRLLKWAEPLLGEKDFNDGKVAVDEFLKNHQDLQEILEQRAANSDNWLAKWWLEQIYLSSRGTIALECNAFCAMRMSALDVFNDVFVKMAIYACGVATYYQDFIKNGVANFEIKGKKISLDQMHGLFSSIRIPRKHIDEYYINSNPSPWMLFLYKNRIYKIRIFHDDNCENIVSCADLCSTFKHIVEQNQAALIPNANFICFANSRDAAADFLDELLEDGQNLQNHDDIKNAIFAISFDELAAVGINEECRNIAFNAKCPNRWWGKGLHSTFDTLGNRGYAHEHAFCDGGVVMQLEEGVNAIIKSLNKDFNNAKILENKELVFNLNNEQRKQLDLWVSDFDKSFNNIYSCYVDLPNIKRQWLKQNNVPSADGFIQVLFQMAQLRTFSKLYNTYVAVDMRNFFKGRTECVRPVSPQSASFAKDFNAKKLSGKTLLDALKSALDEHYIRAKDAQRGHGVNRHLFGLFMTWVESKQELKPMLFDSELYKVISSNKLSTTTVISPHFAGTLFSPVQEDGFGLFYQAMESSFIVASVFEPHKNELLTFLEHFKACANELIAAIEAALKEH